LKPEIILQRRKDFTQIMLDITDQCIKHTKTSGSSSIFCWLMITTLKTLIKALIIGVSCTRAL